MSSGSWRSRRGARCSPTRSTPASTCSSQRCCGRCRRACPTTSPSSSSPTCSSAAKPILGHVAAGLLAGHRQPRPVPPGQLRRARRPRRARALGDPPARQRAARRGRAAARPGADRGAGLHRQLLPDRCRRTGRAVHGARPERGRQGGRHSRSQHGRLGQLRRPQRAARGHHPGQGRGRARARRPERRRRRRRRVLDRSRGGAGAGRQGVPVQDDRGGRGDPRQPDLGVARHHDALRPRRRRRARERRRHLRGRRPARRRLRHDAPAGRPGRVQPRRAPVVADGEAGDHRRPRLDRRARRRPARGASRP